MFRPERLGLVGFAVVFLLSFILHALDGGEAPPPRDDASVRRPAPVAPPEPRRPAPAAPADVLPPISRSDPAIQVRPEKKGNSTGTAFSIGDGVWMTARHVLDGCRTFGIVTAPRQVERGLEPMLSPGHDLAVFHTRRSTPSLGFEPADLRRGQTAFHFGYPQGKPADVRSTLLGRMRVIPAGRQRGEQPVIAWAETARVPKISGSLGGMSGGPAVDAEGDVIGVTVAESPRRGRVFTSAPAGLREALREAGARARETSRGTIDEPIDARGFAATGDRLRAELTVAKVVCWVS